MSDTMLFGVLRMPYELAMSGEMGRRQFYGRAQQATDEIEHLRAELAALRARIDGAQKGRVSDVDGFVTVCHPIEPFDTWPDTLWGKRVALVPLDD